MKRKAYFKSETWLNPQASQSTGSIVGYDGDVEYTEGESPCIFIEIADCQEKVSLHRRTPIPRNNSKKRLIKS